MHNMRRRQFMQVSSTGSAAFGAGLLAQRAIAGPTAPAKPGGEEFVDRIAFGPRMNDTRTAPLPFSGWPPDVFDDVTVESIIRTLDLNQAYGYNIYAIGDQFEAQDKMARLQTALLNTLMMVRTAISSQQWEEQQRKDKTKA